MQPAIACDGVSFRHLLAEPETDAVPAVPILQDLYDPDSDLTPDERHALVVVMQLVRRRVVAAGLA
jgi:hypothetical protein